MNSNRTRALDVLTRLFSSGLNNQFVLLRNLAIPSAEQDEPDFLIPCVLVGPVCLLVINPSDQQGFFRAQEDSWLQMEKNSQNYRPAPHNLIQETLRMAKQLNNVMQASGLLYPEVQPVLFFANTGMHIESERPAVRILKFDTVERFLSALRRDEPLLDARQVQALVDYLSNLYQAAQARQIRSGNKTKSSEFRAADQALSAMDTFVKQQHLKRKQWMILGFLLGATILILMALILAILFLA
ncbi:MAG: hypothetical protein MUC85_03990 [Anaerolineales bacterium]|nr:hypothetical protein [Anaerolineales bacterium]